MKLIWTKSNSILSVLIRAITGEDCSHFAFVLYDNKPGEIMFESNLLGTHPAFYRTSLKTHQIVHEIIVPSSQETEDRVWDKLVEIYDGHPYDFLGALYLGLRTLLKRFLGMTMPIKNSWSRQDSFYCDEIYDALREVPGLPLLNVSGGMDTPHGVYIKLTGG